MHKRIETQFVFELQLALVCILLLLMAQIEILKFLLGSILSMMHKYCDHQSPNEGELAPVAKIISDKNFIASFYKELGASTRLRHVKAVLLSLESVHQKIFGMRAAHSVFSKAM